MEREPAAQRHPDDDSDDEAQRCHRCGGLKYGQRIMPIDSTQARTSNESDDENELGSEEA